MSHIPLYPHGTGSCRKITKEESQRERSLDIEASLSGLVNFLCFAELEVLVHLFYRQRTEYQLKVSVNINNGVGYEFSNVKHNRRDSSRYSRMIYSRTI